MQKLINEEELAKRISDLGEQITKDYQDRDLVCIGLLKGSFIFFADLARKINLPMNIDFMNVSSYGNEAISQGVVKILKDTDLDITDKDILIVEDIIDTGYTLDYVINFLKSKGAKTVKTVVLLDKPSRRKVKIKADYVGFEVPDVFVVGYGIDYAQQYRNLPYIGTANLD